MVLGGFGGSTEGDLLAKQRAAETQGLRSLT